MVNQLTDHVSYKEGIPGHLGDRKKQRPSTVSFLVLVPLVVQQRKPREKIILGQTDDVTAAHEPQYFTL
jgi:hypothetical protein